MKACIIRLSSVLLAVFLLTSCGSDEPTDPEDINEPNDEILTAHELAIDDPVNAFIYPLEDVDFYKITVDPAPEAGGVLVFSLRPFPLYPDMTVYNQDKSQICSYYDTTEGADLHLWMAARPAATYYVKVSIWRSEWRKEPSTDPYVLTVRYMGIEDPNEPDNSFDQATPIDPGVTYSAYLFAGEPAEGEDYVDYYRMKTTRTGKISAQLQDVPGNVYPEMSILRPDGSIVNWQSSPTRGANLTLTTGSVEAGDYYIAVRPKTNFQIPEFHSKGEIPLDHAIAPYSLTAMLE